MSSNNDQPRSHNRISVRALLAALKQYFGHASESTIVEVFGNPERGGLSALAATLEGSQRRLIVHAVNRRGQRTVSVRELESEDDVSLYDYQLSQLGDSRTQLGSMLERLRVNFGSIVEVGSDDHVVHLNAAELAAWFDEMVLLFDGSSVIEERLLLGDHAPVSRLTYVPFAAGAEAIEQSGSSEEIQPESTQIMLEFIRCVGDGSEAWRAAQVIENREGVDDTLLAVLRSLPSDIGEPATEAALEQAGYRIQREP